MKKILKLNKMAITILVVILFTTIFQGIVRAKIDSIIDTDRKASLTITQYENSNGSKENVGLEGAEFTIYLLTNNINTVEEANEYIKSNSVQSFTETTPKNGTIKFSDLELGKYLVVETKVPKNVITKTESFLIDLPRSNDNGNGWDYDIVVSPKNTTIYGEVTLKNLTKGDETTIEGSIWNLEKLDENEEWQKYDYEGDLVTDGKGEIHIENLEKGKYRLVEKETPKEQGYIIDESDTAEFEINEEHLHYEFTKYTEKITMGKYILLNDGNYGKDVGAFSSETNTWKIELKVSDKIDKLKTYSIRDTIPSGINYVENSIKVYGVKENSEKDELSQEYYTDRLNTRSIQINLDTQKIKEYKNIVITYNTKFDDGIVHGVLVNTTKLVYTNHILEDGTSKGTDNILSDATVRTGAILIRKVDENKTPLHGAVFKLATSKEDAMQGNFIDTCTSDYNGDVVFYGLKYDGETEYWIVETESPTYEENGETKHYNLVNKPIKVIVNSTSHDYTEGISPVVVNKKGFVLPMTGGRFSIISILLGLAIILISVIIRKRNSN